MTSCIFTERPPLALDDRASTAYLHALIEHNPIAIIVLDSRHKFQLCNPAFEALFQFNASELSAWGIDSLISGPDLMQEATQLTRRVLNGEQVHTLTRRRRKDGLIVDVDLHGVPLMVDGQVAGVFGLYQDVTERMKLNEAMEQMTTRLNTIREEERRRFARDLHDSLSQELTLLNWNLRKLAQLAPHDSPMQALLNETREIADVCVGQIRTASFLMHPPQLGEADLQSAILWLAEGFGQRSGMRIHLNIQPFPYRLPIEVESALYRMVQEGLANILRHARDSSVTLSLRLEGHALKLTLTNHGTGSEIPTLLSNGVGLSSMRERLEEFGGTLLVTPLHAGVQLSASIPFHQAERCAS
jgi:PAS domain S-box-containing protein